MMEKSNYHDSPSSHAFVGAYPQTVFTPLVGTLLLVLVASYIISVTPVPLLSFYSLSIKNPILLKVEDSNNQIKSLLGLLNFAIQVNPKYSKYKYLIEKRLFFRTQKNLI